MSQLLSIGISILGILFTIFFVIGTHEFAHFIVARLLKVKVLRFSIGFGKTLLRWHDKKGTEYVFALVPLGGYVKMLDETEGPVDSHEVQYAFNRQPLYKKSLIVIAGPMMNILCAFFLYWAILMMGFTTLRPVIGSVVPGSIAARGGLQAGQEIIRTDSTETPVWTGVLIRLLSHAGNHDQLQLEIKQPKTNKITTHTLDLSQWHLDELNPNPLKSIGIVPYEPPISLSIYQIAKDSPAALSGLQTGDTLIAINQTKIKNWDELMQFIQQHPDTSLTFTLKRNNKIIQRVVQIGYQRTLLLQKVGYLGIAPRIVIPPDALQKIQYNAGQAAIKAMQEVIDFTYFNAVILGKIITGKLSLKTLGGPITIFESAGAALHYGLISFLGFLAFLSISIGIINFIPIPSLDGGHLFIYMIESLIRRPIPENILLLFYRFGFIIIFLLLIQTIVNDVLRLF